MKVAIITEEDLFYVREFFATLYAKTEDRKYDISGVTILPAFNKKSTLDLAKQMFGFYGPFHFVRVGTQYVWRKLIKKTIRKLTSDSGFTLIDNNNVNSDEYIQWLKDEKVDVIVSIAAPVIFKEKLLQATPKGCINSHSALLPENRGMMPVFWGLFKGSKEIGVTIHTMGEELDKGSVLMQEIVPVGNESLHEMIMKTKRISAGLIHQTLNTMATGTIEETLIPDGGSYQTFPTPAEVKEFKKRGKRMF